MMDMDMNARLTRIDNLPPNPNYPPIRPLSLNFEEFCSDLDVILPIDQLLRGIGTTVVLRICVRGEAVGLFAGVPDLYHPIYIYIGSWDVVWHKDEARQGKRSEDEKRISLRYYHTIPSLSLFLFSSIFLSA